MGSKTINFGKQLEILTQANKTRGLTIKTLLDRLSDVKIAATQNREEIEKINEESQIIGTVELQELRYIYEHGSLESFVPKTAVWFDNQIDRLKTHNLSLMSRQTAIHKSIDLNKKQVGESTKKINEIKNLKRRVDGLKVEDTSKKSVKEWRIYDYDINPTEETIEVETFHWSRDEFVCSITYHTFRRTSVPRQGKWNRVKRNGLLNKVSTVKDKDLTKLLNVYLNNKQKDHEFSS